MANTIATIDVTPMEDAPTAASIAVVTVEDTQRVFSIGDFGFYVDTGDTLHWVKITQLESAGALKLNGVDVAIDQEISVADISRMETDI